MLKSKFIKILTLTGAIFFAQNLKRLNLQFVDLALLK